MDPVDKAVAFCMSEKPADPFLSAIARNILILVLRARSWVSPINIDIAQINYLFFTELTKIYNKSKSYKKCYIKKLIILYLLSFHYLLNIYVKLIEI